VFTLEAEMAKCVLPAFSPTVGADAGGLRVQQLTIQPPGAAALFDDIAFGAGPGEAVVIRGPNGVGKTSMFRPGTLTPRGQGGLPGPLDPATQEASDTLPFESPCDLVEATYRRPPWLSGSYPPRFRTLAGLWDGGARAEVCVHLYT
jgi:hypothetical protein